MNDAQELNAISEVYCKNRTKPLLIGSVKSNIGDCEPVSGLCGVLKTVLAMENQQIPATLHYSSPNPGVPALKDGRLQVVSKPLPWTGEYAAVNAVGIGGLNAQALLKANGIEKKPQPQDPIARLIVGSARTESAINYMLNRVSFFCFIVFSIVLENNNVPNVRRSKPRPEIRNGTVCCTGFTVKTSPDTITGGTPFWEKTTVAKRRYV